MSEVAISYFIGNDRELIDRVRPVLLICILMPLLVSIQNALQGFLVSEGRTWSINQAAWIGAIVMLASAYFASQLEQNGAISAAIGMILGNTIEIGYLVYRWRSKN